MTIPLRGPPGAPSFSPRGRFSSWLFLAVCALYLGLYSAGLLLEAPTLALNVAYYAVAAAAVCSLAVSAVRRNGRARLSAALVATTALCWLVGDGLFSAWDGEPPPIADGAYYAGYVALACAIPLAGLPRDMRPDWHALLDGLAVTIVIGSLAWRFIVEPSVADSGSAMGAVLTAGYPVVDLAVLAMLVLTLYQRASGAALRQFVVLALAAAIMVATDGAYLIWSLQGQPADPSILDVGWMATYLLFAALPFLQEETARQSAPRRTLSTFRMALPYALTIPFAVVAFTDASKGSGIPPLLGGLFIVTTIILVRQWLTLAENARLHARTEYLLRHDSLTGLLSHRAWFEAASGPGVRSVAVIDVDHFKAINDRLGHPSGDDVLVEIARRLRAALSDATPLGRIGGEEFAALFDRPAREVMVLCDAAIGEVGGSPVRLPDGKEVTVSVSVGLSDVGPGKTGVDTYRDADGLLYRAKRDGRNRLRVA